MGFKRPLVQIQSLGPKKQGYLLVPLFLCLGSLVRTPAASCHTISGREAAWAASIAAFHQTLATGAQRTSPRRGFKSSHSDRERVLRSKDFRAFSFLSTINVLLERRALIRPCKPTAYAARREQCESIGGNCCWRLRPLATAAGKA